MMPKQTKAEELDDFINGLTQEEEGITSYDDEDED